MQEVVARRSRTPHPRKPRASSDFHILAVLHIRSESSEEIDVGRVQMPTADLRLNAECLRLPGLRPGLCLEGNLDVSHLLCALDQRVSSPETAGTMYPTLGQADRQVSDTGHNS